MGRVGWVTLRIWFGAKTGDTRTPAACEALLLLGKEGQRPGQAPHWLESRARVRATGSGLLLALVEGTQAFLSPVQYGAGGKWEREA